MERLYSLIRRYTPGFRAMLTPESVLPTFEEMPFFQESDEQSENIALVLGHRLSCSKELKPTDSLEKNLRFSS